MKKLVVLLGIILSSVLYVSAQTANGQGTGNGHTAFGRTHPGGAKNKKGKSAKVVNQRRMYKSPKTGQTATPTGQQATGVNASEAPNPKNAAKTDSTH